VVDLLHCGRQKAVNTLRELQYAELIDIKKQGCGKPNCIYLKSYEAVSPSKQARAIDAALAGINPLNAGKKKEEALALLKK